MVVKYILSDLNFYLGLYIMNKLLKKTKKSNFMRAIVFLYFGFLICFFIIVTNTPSKVSMF